MDSFQLLITFVFIFIVYLVINQITFSRTLQLCIIVIFVLHYQKADKSNCIGFDYFAVLNKFKNFNMTKYFEPKKAYKPTLYLDDHKENFREIDLIKEMTKYQSRNVSPEYFLQKPSDMSDTDFITNKIMDAYKVSRKQIEHENFVQQSLMNENKKPLTYDDKDQLMNGDNQPCFKITNDCNQLSIKTTDDKQPLNISGEKEYSENNYKKNIYDGIGSLGDNKIAHLMKYSSNKNRVAIDNMSRQNKYTNINYFTQELNDRANCVWWDDDSLEQEF